MRDTLFSLLLLPAMLFSYKEALQLIPITIEGIVVDEKTGSSIGKAHVYIVYGEEETFTDEKGRFRLSTWQKLPVTVKIVHHDFELQKIVIRSASDKTISKLKRK